MLAHHTDNVQSVKWNLDMTIILTSASFDGSLVVLDGRAASKELLVSMAEHAARQSSLVVN
ncbi:hypothetical protein H257_14169 [Aphanomyces astaci]|uniref:Uncharacterized protein n=1 Tax=Aphanomyces astaci TaxID=112090 RepID=W4FS14_APHAT|nr:hypothetical protein H257_14169 [Aphanomyces astaci]ETV70267.1 hypothetical protein H257_14169 [Aphanomyces astaci]|eukprot:XP_009840226.1 hypothetical protein H257_14169 [Aphanomyces astaci]